MDDETSPPDIEARSEAVSAPTKRRKSAFRRPRGRPPQHGAAMLTRVLRGVDLRRIDGRSAVGVALRRTRQELMDHLGGEDEVTAPERILCEEAVKLRIVAARVGSWLMERETLATPKGELLPAVEAHARLVNNLAKVLKLLGMKRAMREVTVADTFQQLHEQRRNETQ